MIDLAVSTRIIVVHFYFFFLQAEDGIRDGHVTGVQTCALPIWGRVPRRPPRRGADGRDDIGRVVRRGRLPPGALPHPLPEIGRASCRERVSTWVLPVASNIESNNISSPFSLHTYRILV